MKHIIQTGLSVILFILLTNCNGQPKPHKQSLTVVKSDPTKQVGGGCEGCDLMYVGMPNEILSEHTSLGWTQGKQKLMLTGKVYHLDGKTPASNVVIYYWHTDDKGLYSSNNKTNATDHGDLRGWVKSDEKGNYTIKTSHPAAYPNEDIAEHIHLVIKEPDVPNEYYADLYFEEDPLYANHQKKYGKLDRAGTEIVRVVLDNTIQVAKHNVILGLNIPNYPVK